MSKDKTNFIMMYLALVFVESY